MGIAGSLNPLSEVDCRSFRSSALSSDPVLKRAVAQVDILLLLEEQAVEGPAETRNAPEHFVSGHRRRESWLLLLTKGQPARSIHVIVK